MLATSPSSRTNMLRLQWHERILTAFWQDLIYFGADTKGKARIKKVSSPQDQSFLVSCFFFWLFVVIRFFQTIPNNLFPKRNFIRIKLYLHKMLHGFVCYLTYPFWLRFPTVTYCTPHWAYSLIFLRWNWVMGAHNIFFCLYMPESSQTQRKYLHIYTCIHF